MNPAEVGHERRDKGTERVEVLVRSSGGCETGHEVRRPVGRYERMSDLPALLGRIEALRAEGQSLATVAGRLNAEGFSPRSARGSSPPRC
ncbi:hypothetical protein [Paludisphaera mucosa]|uniref:Uncharacterized protein n=1 Tax=Paludisphaera mucosa TaxID=3030827 RepID=A0ABT6FJG1_9BACT|nr:hypothetical protein [Paludisphaera mucosa]MDG3007716.1 hypothetical protein [Paludisphaera mucosa]